MEPKIIYQDELLLAIDKPSGWITNEADTTTSQPVLQTWIKNSFDFQTAKNDEFRSGIAHRLDKETSGILLIAKTPDALTNLQMQFKERKIKKTYVALLHGNLKPGTGKIETEVGRLPWRRDRFGVLPGGRKSETEYKVLNYYEMPHQKPHLKSYSLVEFYPKTGRTHQIRIHSKFVGHPVVGDEFYAGRKTARADRKWCPRLFLHAHQISLELPKEKVLTLSSELPNELASVLNGLSLLT